MKINGYLIQNQEGDYLTEGYGWFPHEEFKDAWVHPENKLERLLGQSKEWKTKPAKLTKATYDTERKKSTILVSDPIDIQGLGIKQTKDLLRRNP